MSEEKHYSPGLEGVIAGVTSISEVDPKLRKLTYRGYDIETLAKNSRYEEVAYLILNGDLPSKSQLERFTSQLTLERELPPQINNLISSMPQSTDPMDALRTCVSYLGGLDPDINDSSHDANLRKAIRLTSKIATIIAAHHRARNGLKPLNPSKELSHAGNLLYMIFGERPEDYQVKALDTSLILYAEHTFNASTFTARVIASTLSDLHAAVVGAIGALKGPLHGRANERVIEMLLEIESPSRAEEWIMKALREKQRIMGFGHRIYKWGDSRVPVMKNLGYTLAAQLKERRFVEVADIVEKVMAREKNLYPNLDFPSAYVYYMLGLPPLLYTPLFAASRIVGWAAHIIEQHDDNRLIRPDCIYRGQRNRIYIPIEERGKRNLC